MVWDIHNDSTVTALWFVLFCAKEMVNVNYHFEWHSFRQFKLKYF